MDYRWLPPRNYYITTRDPWPRCYDTQTASGLAQEQQRSVSSPLGCDALFRAGGRLELSYEARNNGRINGSFGYPRLPAEFPPKRPKDYTLEEGQVMPFSCMHEQRGALESNGHLMASPPARSLTVVDGVANALPLLYNGTQPHEPPPSHSIVRASLPSYAKCPPAPLRLQVVIAGPNTPTCAHMHTRRDPTEWRRLREAATTRWTHCVWQRRVVPLLLPLHARPCFCQLTAAGFWLTTNPSMVFLIVLHPCSAGYG